MGGVQHSKDCVVLAASADGQQCLLIQLPNAEGEVVWAAGLPSGADSIDRVVQKTDLGDYLGRWNHWAFVKDCVAGEMRVYRNGKLQYKNETKEAKGVALRQFVVGISKVALGGGLGSGSSWIGQLAELRIWNVALGEREIESNSVLVLSGDKPGLVAYFPLREADGNKACDHSGNGRDISLAGLGWSACTAPIGRLLNANDSGVSAPMLASVEYSRIRIEDQRRKAMMLRCLALPTAQGLLLLDEQRIEELEMRWIGNAQIQPTLLGYIEGPPLPSENLTEEDDYNGATSVDLVQSSDVEYSWTRNEDASLGAEASFFLGSTRRPSRA